jgi:oligosaccharide repeat unit polymerase
MTSSCRNSSVGSSGGWTIAVLLAVMGTLVSLAVVWISFRRSLISVLGILLMVFTTLTAWPIVSDLRRSRFDPLESRNVFFYVFFLYGASLPFLTYIRGESVSEVATTAAIVKAFAITAISLIFFLVGYGSRVAVRITSALPAIGEVPADRLRVTTLAVVGASLLWFLAFLYSIGGLGEFLHTGYGDIYEIEVGKEYLGFSLTLIPTCALLLFHLANRARSRITWLASALAIAFSLFLLFSGSRRRLMVTLILSMLLYFHYAIRRVSPKLLLSLTFIGALAVSSLGLLRSIPPEELLNRGTVQFLADHSSSDLFYTFLEAGEPATDFETFPFLVHEISNGMPYQWGKTYFEAPLIMIPKALYPGRPMTASQWYTAKFFPDVAAQLGGRPLFFLGEAYLNFGLFGPPALMFLVGVGCRVVYAYLKKNRFSAEAALVYAAILGCIPSAIRIDIATTLKVSIASTLPVIFFVIWYSRARSLVRESPPSAAQEVHG